jgi:hypothetical protein
VISYAVARWQAQDAARQASTGEQVTAVVQLETDARTFVTEADRLIRVRRHCSGQPTPTPDCKKEAETPVYDSPLIGMGLALGTDLANISDAAARKDAYILQGDALQALPDATGNRDSASSRPWAAHTRCCSPSAAQARQSPRPERRDQGLLASIHRRLGWFMGAAMRKVPSELG